MEHAAAENESAYGRYWDAIRRRVCSVCLDGRDDGSCGLSGARVCALQEHLARLVETIRDVLSSRDHDHAAAVEAHVCSQCADRGPLGRCSLKHDGRCALAVYLPLVVEAVAEVDGA